MPEEMLRPRWPSCLGINTTAPWLVTPTCYSTFCTWNSTKLFCRSKHCCKFTFIWQIKINLHRCTHIVLHISNQNICSLPNQKKALEMGTSFDRGLAGKPGRGLICWGLVWKKVLGWVSLHIGAPFGDLGRERWTKGTHCIVLISPFSA